MEIPKNVLKLLIEFIILNKNKQTFLSEELQIKILILSIQVIKKMSKFMFNNHRFIYVCFDFTKINSKKIT